MVEKYLLVRHGEAEPRQEGQAQEERLLTGKGFSQALALGVRLADTRAFPDLGIRSPAQRSSDTLLLAIGAAIGRVGFEIKLARVGSLLYMGRENARTALAAIDRLAAGGDPDCVPLSSILAEPEGDIFRNHATVVSKDINDAVGVAGGTRTVLLVGHSYLLNTVALGLYGGEHPLIMGPTPGHAQGFSIVPGQSVEAL